MNHRLLSIVLALTLVSCVVQRKAVFNEADARWAGATGTGSVKGRVFVIMQNESERVARNTTIDLAPVTPYYAEIISMAFDRNRKLSPGDPRAKKYVRTAPTNDEGEFEFHNLPTGDYFLGTDVSWKHSFLDADSNSVSVNEVVPIYARVSVKSSQTVNVSDWTHGRQGSN